MMFLQVIILLAGFLFLVKGADWFVEGAASIAKKLGIPQLIIGLTIVAMGTSMPEAAVSITAAINKNAGITIGNVVGSNILNIFIILGITAVITNVAIQKSTLLYEIPFMTVITIILLIFGITGSEVTFIEGVIFWILFLIYLGYLFVMAKKGNDLLLPTIFPMAIPVFPLLAAVTDVTSSGRDVPSATIVSPINLSLMPK